MSNLEMVVLSTAAAAALAVDARGGKIFLARAAGSEDAETGVIGTGIVSCVFGNAGGCEAEEGNESKPELEDCGFGCGIVVVGTTTDDVDVEVVDTWVT